MRSCWEFVWKYTSTERLWTLWLMSRPFIWMLLFALDVCCSQGENNCLPWMPDPQWRGSAKEEKEWITKLKNRLHGDCAEKMDIIEGVITVPPPPWKLNCINDAKTMISKNTLIRCWQQMLMIGFQLELLIRYAIKRNSGITSLFLSHSYFSTTMAHLSGGQTDKLRNKCITTEISDQWWMARQQVENVPSRAYCCLCTFKHTKVQLKVQ